MKAYSKVEVTKICLEMTQAEAVWLRTIMHEMRITYGKTPYSPLDPRFVQAIRIEEAIGMAL